MHSLELWRNFICGNETGSPGRAVSLHLARSGSQSERRFRRILPARGAYHIIMDYIDYCTVMGWVERKDGCQYDDQSEDGKNQWKKQNLCMSTLRATLPSKMKRLINPNNKTLGLSEEAKSDPVKVIQALVKRFGGSSS